MQCLPQPVAYPSAAAQHFFLKKETHYDIFMQNADSSLFLTISSHIHHIALRDTRNDLGRSVEGCPDAASAA